MPQPPDCCKSPPKSLENNYKKDLEAKKKVLY